MRLSDGAEIDARRFRAAAAADDLQAGLRSYGGPLLAQFEVRGGTQLCGVG